MNYKIGNLNVSIFFNNYRGLKVLYHLKKKIKNISVFLSRKNLNKRILNELNKKKIKFLIINSLNSKIVKQKIKNCQICIVAGFPYIFKKELIHHSNYGIINCHAGPLPKYRGGSPLNWQIINGEKYIGISTIKINDKIDEGKIITQKKFLLKKEYTINDVHLIVNNSFPELVEKSINYVITKKKLKTQNKKKASYYKQRKRSDSLLKFKDMKFNEINNFVRALKYPYPLPYFFIRNKKIHVKKIQKSSIKFFLGNTKILNNKIYIKCLNSIIRVFY